MITYASRNHLPMRRLRIREVNSSASGCTAGHFQSSFCSIMLCPLRGSSKTTRKLVATCGLARESRRLSSGASKFQWPGTQRGQRIPEPVVYAKEKEKRMIQMRWLSYGLLPPSPSLPCRELCCHMVPNQCTLPPPEHRCPDTAVSTRLEAQLAPKTFWPLQYGDREPQRPVSAHAALQGSRGNRQC